MSYALLTKSIFHSGGGQGSEPTDILCKYEKVLSFIFPFAASALQLSFPFPRVPPRVQP